MEKMSQAVITTPLSLRKSGNFSFKRKAFNSFFKLSLYLSVSVTVLLLAFLIGYIFFRGIRCLNWNLLSTQTSYLDNNIGILPNILNTLYIIFLTLIIAIILGIGSAIYLNEYAKNRQFISLIEFAVETLAGIPSIIFGLVGMLIFTQILGLRQGILAGALTLVIMILPIIVRTTQEALKTVPQMYKDGSLALGSTKWHMIRTVVLPNAKAGIITGVVLSIGRIVSESAALLFTAGFGLNLNGFVESLQSSSATLTVALYVYASERGEIDVSFAISLVLLIITLLINAFVNLFAKDNNKR